ncbi:helix-turn-helix domain-containing protein [Ferrimonas futtsuensis]|uniref:helix-turn-helix domain-containing protein n=1 Tax=Ferrimonas futtsuensis TaxID=364764 RepID=UPI003CCBBE0D
MHPRVVEELLKGVSIRRTAAITGVSVSTVQRVKKSNSYSCSGYLEVQKAS